MTTHTTTDSTAARTIPLRTARRRVPPAPPTPPRPDLWQAAARLNRLDWWLLDMLTEHRALTTDQLTSLNCADPPPRLRRRLRMLADRGVLAAVTVETGQPTVLWCPGPVGIQAVAITEPGRRFRSADFEAACPRLATHPGTRHLLAVNQFFVDLAAHARTHPHTDLRTWWSPRTSRAVVAPAGHDTRHGEYLHRGRRIGFWLEHDPGPTMPVARLAARIRRYPALAGRTGLGTVLFWMATASREQLLHQHLAHHDVGGLTVATTNSTLDNPATAVWQLPDADERIGLHRLPDTPQLPHPNDDAFPGECRRLAPHPIYDPNRPGDETVADGHYSYG